MQWNLDITNLYITKSCIIFGLYVLFFGKMNDFLYPSYSKIYENEPRYDETSV